jgi:hypothetical protein
MFTSTIAIRPIASQALQTRGRSIMTLRTATGPFSFINYGVGWDVAGTPTNGDTFVVNTGTAIMVGGRFPDSMVDLGRAFNTNTGTYLPNPNLLMFGNTDLGTIDVTTQTPDRSGAHLTVVGHATVGAIVIHGSPSGTALTGNLAPGSRLTTHFEGQPRTGINLTGGTLDNRGDSVVGAATISSNIAGHGSFEVLGFFGSLHVEGSVSAGQSVKLDGVSVLTVDHPADFHASVDISDLVPSGSINLLGIHGDAWTYNNSRLSITSGSNIVERLRLTAGSHSFTVSDTSNGIVINPSLAPQQSSGLVT